MPTLNVPIDIRNIAAADYCCPSLRHDGGVGIVHPETACCGDGITRDSEERIAERAGAVEFERSVGNGQEPGRIRAQDRNGTAGLERQTLAYCWFLYSG